MLSLLFDPFFIFNTCSDLYDWTFMFSGTDLMTPENKNLSEVLSRRNTEQEAKSPNFSC